MIVLNNCIIAQNSVKYSDILYLKILGEHMYFEIIMMVMILVPLITILTSLRINQYGYNAVKNAILTTSICMLLVFLVACIQGINPSSAVQKIIDAAIKTTTENKEMVEAIKAKGWTVDEFKEKMQLIYDQMQMLIPSMILIFSALVSYVEYKIIAAAHRSKLKLAERYKLEIKVRNFALANKDILGWFFIYLIAYLTKYVGYEQASILTTNISVLIENVIALQGVALLLTIAHNRKWPKVVMPIVVIILWFMNFGKNVLFMFGMLDLLFGIRNRTINITRIQK